MNFRLTAVLFAAVLGLAVGLLVWSLVDTDPAAGSGLLLADLGGAKPAQITAVAIEPPDGPTVKLERAGKDGWRVTDPAAGRADPAAVNAVLSSLLDARPTQYGETPASPAANGLDRPLKVTLTDDAGQSAALHVGNVTVGGGGGLAGTEAVAFVNTPGRPRPLAVRRSVVEPLFRVTGQSGKAADLAKGANDYRARAVFAAGGGGGADDATAVKLTQKGKDLALTKGGAGWTFAAPAGWGDVAAGDSTGTGVTGARSLVAAVTSLQAGSADDFLPAPADLKEYGLNPDNPDLLRVEVTGKDGAAEVAYVGKKVEPPAPADKGAVPPPKSNKVYVRVEGVPGVIRATAGEGFDALAGLVADPAPLRDRDLVRDDIRTRTDAIDVTVGKDTLKLRKVGGEWKLVGGPGDPQPANQKAVTDLLALLTQPKLVKEFPAPNDANFAGPELKAEVKLWADAVEPSTDPKAEPKLRPAVNPTVLQLGKREPTGVYVRRTLPAGGKADFVVSDKVKLADPIETDVVAAASRGRLGYLDPKLPGFSQFQANKLTVSQGPAVLEVARDKADWKFAQPPAQKDRAADAGAVADLLALLATQAAGRFVSEAPGKDDLVKYGLTAEAPRLKATVALDPGFGTPADADKERTYLLGNPTEDGQGVYARVTGREAVFTVPKLLFDRLAAPDLRDKVVVRFERSKVNAVNLRGWKSTGFIVELGFERKGGEWVVTKSPAGYAVDGAKVDKFLDALSGLRAKTFIPGPPTDEKYKLIPEAGGLQIGLGVEGGPGVGLFVGGPAEADTLYAQILTLPANENMVTVPADVFKPFTASPAAFAK